MKLPRRHVVGEVEIQVVSEEIRDTGAQALYTTTSGEPVIRIQKGLRGNYRHFCQLHEFGHAVLDMSEITLGSEVEERVVGAFAAAILRLLKDTAAVNKQDCKVCATMATDSQKETP